MFETLVYFDKEKVQKYHAVINRERMIKDKKIKISNTKEGGGTLPIVSGKIAINMEYEGEEVENSLLDCKEFEDSLAKIGSECNYFDFFENVYSIECINRSSIIKFEGSFYIPDEFDGPSTLDLFKEEFLQNETNESFKKIMSKENKNIPIFIDSDNIERIMFSNINLDNLCFSFDNIEEYEKEDTTFIAKITKKRTIKGKSEIVYDIYKDYLGFDRVLRRQVGTPPKIEGLDDIEVDKDYLVLELLAAYQ